MNRLSDTAIEIVNELHTERLDYDSEYLPLINALNRLAAYEDTGLEPDEAEACKVALMGKSLTEIKEIEGISVERMKDLAKAEAEGRLLVLPCKVGDRVWLIVQGMSSPMPVPVCSLTWRDGKWSINADREETEPPKVVGFQIGKTAFLTREEAETALRKEPDNG